MSHAYYSQKGAEEHANDWTIKAKNYDAHKRYYQKLYVDKRHATREAARNLKLAEDAVKTANNKIHHSKDLDFDHADHLHELNRQKLYVAEEDAHMAEDGAVRHGMYNAYETASAGEIGQPPPPPPS